MDASFVARCFRSFMSDWFTVMRKIQVENLESSRNAARFWCLKKCFLNCILRVFSVMRDALSNSEKFAIISLYELLESGNVPILGGVDKIQVLVCHFPHCEFCRVCRHI